jgi:hypothetical protein
VRPGLYPPKWFFFLQNLFIGPGGPTFRRSSNDILGCFRTFQGWRLRILTAILVMVVSALRATGEIDNKEEFARGERPFTRLRALLLLYNIRPVVFPGLWGTRRGVVYQIYRHREVLRVYFFDLGGLSTDSPVQHR